MLGLVVAVVAITFGQVASPRQSSEPAAPAGTNLRCGEYCLFLALRSLDFPLTSVVELETHLGQPTLRGYSLQQLSDTARSLGAHTLGVQTSLEQLERRTGRFACIAFLEQSNHFVCIYDIDDKTVYIADPPGRRIVSREAFARLWNGKSLLIADRPIDPNVPAGSPPWWAISLIVLAIACLVAVTARKALGRTSPIGFSAACGLLMTILCASCSSPRKEIERGVPLAKVDPLVVDVGRIEVDKDPHGVGEFRIRNTGTGVLRILETSVTCGCTMPTWPPPSISPGGEVTVPVRVKARNETGEHSSLVSVTTNDPVNSHLEVRIRWSERHAITCNPATIDFGTVESGKLAKAALEVDLSRHFTKDQLRVDCYDPNISWDWEGDSVQRGEAGSSRKLCIRLKAPGEQGAGAAVLRLATANGAYSARVSVRPNHPGRGR
jgi:hypothetical protein